MPLKNVVKVNYSLCVHICIIHSKHVYQSMSNEWGGDNRNRIQTQHVLGWLDGQGTKQGQMVV